MDRERMRALINQHIRAEADGDIGAAVAVYTHDVEHDVVGAPDGVLHGPEAAARRYEDLLHAVADSRLVEKRSYFGEDFCLIEHETTASIVGQFAGLEGGGRRVTFRMLHVFEFRDDAISRENVWMDTASVIVQLSHPRQAAGVP
jgi:predicted ester cyclase